MKEQKDMNLLNASQLNQVSGGTAQGGTETFNKIQEILANTLGISAGSVRENSRIIDDLGAASLDIVDIVRSMEGHFQIKVDDAKLESIKTVQDLCRIVNGIM